MQELITTCDCSLTHLILYQQRQKLKLREILCKSIAYCRCPLINNKRPHDCLLQLWNVRKSEFPWQTMKLEDFKINRLEHNTDKNISNDQCLQTEKLSVYAHDLRQSTINQSQQRKFRTGGDNHPGRFDPSVHHPNPGFLKDWIGSWD